ncbi:chromosome condensation regulator, RCC1 repeat-containing protein [Bacteriovorax sp. BSW11_IV]|uniref:chromosome condensation regulator, RCC1 repeat-containing protein n=1 Tax=Bacteriovorax sp. BSW11_IV TaxID=1353529 RepID=UPI00038A5577|nr:chromosome condensation regulator, RCC1 repeat-containing protein [Bacteriovorax sp. BSW11_IV]EQC48260.1 chromosome condensation regulator, RCC1 repeat-containing protein [Bacteriovorax sp. BSW11_IV]
MKVFLITFLFFLVGCIQDPKIIVDIASDIKSAGGSELPDSGSDSFSFTLSDTSTNSQTHTNNSSIDIVKTGGTDQIKFCISETQPTAPLNTDDGSCAGGNWVTTFPSTLTLSGGDGSKTVYIYTADGDENIATPSVSKSIVLDTTNPSSTSALSLGAVPASLSTSPTITWTTDATDNISLSGYQVRVVKVSGSTVVQDWITLVKGSAVSGLSLESTTDYRIEVRAIDDAGNVSSTQSATFTTLSLTGSLTLGSTTSTILNQSGVGPGTAKTITLTNSGGMATGVLQAPVIYGSTDFQVANDTCTGVVLNPGDTCTVDVQLNGSSDGYYLGNIYIGDGTIVSAEHSLRAMAYGFGTGNGYFVGVWDVGTIADVYDENKFKSLVPNEFTEVLGMFTWSKIIGGEMMSCGITTQAKLYCWGQSYYGAIGNGLAVPSYLPQIVDYKKTWKDAAVGFRSVCGIDGNDDLYCWGDNNYYQLANGTQVDSYVPALVPGGHKWKMVSASSGTHYCAINMTDDLYCWGRNHFGQIGMGDNTTVITGLTQVSSGTKFKSISAGVNSSCALTLAGAGYCWGMGSNHVLGDGNSVDTYSPTAVAGGHTFTKLEMYHFHACGLTNASEIYCWGSDFSNNGNLGDGTGASSPVPVKVAGTHVWKDVSVTGRHTCGLDTTNQMFCWGEGEEGEIGNGDVADQLLPTLVVGGYDWASMAGSAYMSCGVTSTGRAFCWGQYFNWGQMGNGLYSSTVFIPKKIPGDRTWKKIAGGYISFCGIDSSDDLYCAADDNYGEIGNGAGDTSPHSHPVLVNGGYKWLEISATSETVCGVTLANVGYCWGRNNYGQVGSGDATAIFHEPNLVVGGHSWLKIDVGYNHVCGIRTDQTAYCWGYNRYGQFGNGIATGTTTPGPTPTAVSGGLTFKDIAVADNTSCGLTTTDEIYCWGRDNRGQLGNDASYVDQSTPVKVSGGGTWSSLDSGGDHMCALRPDGNAYCWGSGSNGATGSFSNTPEPRLVQGGISWSVIKTGGWHTCGLESGTGEMYCFGYNDGNETGVYPDEYYSSRTDPLLFDRGIKFSEIFLGGSATYGIIAP